MGQLVQRLGRRGRAGLADQVVARNPNHLDLFVTGTDGRIYSCWWDASGGWAAWFNVSGGRAALGSKVTAIARNPNHLDLFVTGTDGRIYSCWWDQSGGWSAWFNVSGGAAALGSPITAIARNPNHLDLFVTGTDGRIYSRWWDQSGGWSAWFNVSGGAAALRLADHGGGAQSQSPRSVRHRHRRADLLLLVGQSGGWAAWFNVSGGAAALTSEVTAIARNPNHLDLFVTGTDGRIYSTWWHRANGSACMSRCSASPPRSRGRR